MYCCYVMDGSDSLFDNKSAIPTLIADNLPGM